MSASTLLTMTALAAIDPTFQSQVEVAPQPQVKPLKTHQMERARSVMQSPSQKVRRINQPAARGAIVRNEPCRRS
jgi:hypothetical protein